MNVTRARLAHWSLGRLLALQYVTETSAVNIITCHIITLLIAQTDIDIIIYKNTSSIHCFATARPTL